MRERQGGLALFMSLVMLLLLTVLGVSAVQTTALQQRMVRNAIDASLAFQAAESALRDGEDFLQTLDSLAAFDAPGAERNGLYYAAAPGAAPNWRAADYRAAETGVTGVAEQPGYILEHLKVVIFPADDASPDACRTWIFRITARGTGGTRAARALVQSTWGRRFPEALGGCAGAPDDNTGRLSWRRLAP